MRYRMLKSRRQFLQNIVFGGVAFALSGTLWAANDSTAPLTTSPMPQPDVPMPRRVAFSPLTGRMAVSAGPDEEQASLYINLPDAPEDFHVYWSPDTEVHGVVSLAWSHNEDALAFIGMSGSRTTDTGKVCLYLLDVTSGKIREVLKIVEAEHGQERRLVNVDEDRALLAWFGNNKVCMNTRDNSIIAVDCNNGHIETLVPPQDGKIRCLVSASSNKLRFLKGAKLPSQGYELEVCDFDGQQVISYGIIPIDPNRISPIPAWLSTDGAYAFIGVKEKPESMFANKTIIFDLSQWVSVKEIPFRVRVGAMSYGYIPLTVLKRKQVVLFETIFPRQIRLVTIEL